MEKSVYTHEYQALLRLLKETRQAAPMTQIELADALGQTQSFVSKCERGERRLDLIQLRTICHVLGTTLPDFVAELELRLRSRTSGNRRTRRNK